MWRVCAGLWFPVNTHPEERAEWPQMAHDFRLKKHLRRIWGLSRCVSREGKQRKVSSSWPSQGVVQRPGSYPPHRVRAPHPRAGHPALWQRLRTAPTGAPTAPFSATPSSSPRPTDTPGTADLRAPVYFPGAMASRQHWSENKKETHRGHRVSLRASLCEHCLGIQTPLLPKKQGGRFSSSSPLQRARPLSPGRLLLCWAQNSLRAIVD